MNSHAANAAVAGRLSLNARLAPGARTTVNGCGPAVSLPASASSCGSFTRPPLCHEEGHLFCAGGLASCKRGLGLTYPCHRCRIGEQFDGGLKRLKILGRNQHNILATIPCDVDAVVSAIDFVGHL